MKLSKKVLLIAAVIGMMTLMSTTCSKSEENGDPANCNGYATAAASGNISGTFCFDVLTTFTYQPNSYVTLWASQGTVYGFDVRLNSDNGAALVPGTYNCGSGELGFVELIYETESGADNEFYKSQAGTITVSEVGENTFKGTFNVSAEGYYNKKTISFSGSFSN